MDNSTSIRNNLDVVLADLDSLDKKLEKVTTAANALVEKHSFYRNRFSKRMADTFLLGAGAFGIGTGSYVGGFTYFFGQNAFSIGCGILDGLGVVGMLYFMSPVVRDLFKRSY